MKIATELIEAIRTANPIDILERAGFRDFRGNRATCPHCEGRRRHTVSVRGELFYCHRCQRGGNVRRLARQQGLKLSSPRIRLADRPKTEFRKWLSVKMAELANQERRLYRRAEWAKVVLSYYPDMEPAWNALADWYHAERAFLSFWESATDRIGRYWLYRSWRKHYFAH
jgi:hypothetical protein